MASKLAKEEPIYNNEVIRIVMVGKTGAGKSATGNTILGNKCFVSEFSFESVTADCAKAGGEVDGQKVAVIDTPGLFDTSIDEEKTSKNVGQSINQASPGPHIFLVIIKLGRFTKEEKKTVEMIQEIFGQEADKYSMVLFTHGDQVIGKPIEELLEKSKDLKELVAKCNGQYHVFNNNEPKDGSQVSELLKKIRNITEKNGGNHYTNEMFQKAERAIEEEKRRIQEEKEEQIRKEREEMERKIKEEQEEELKKMKADMEKEKMEREKKEKHEEELRKEKAEMERMEMERKMNEKIEELKKIKDDMEREKMERRMREEHEQEIRQMKAEREREEMERKMKEKLDEELRKIKADERENQLRAAQQREMDEQNRRLTEMQFQAFRQLAERNIRPEPCVIS